MNTLATIFFSLIAVLASLVFVLLTLCAFGSGIGGDQDLHFALLIALVALVIAIASR
jgi:hypothetical protein